MGTLVASPSWGGGAGRRGFGAPRSQPEAPALGFLAASEPDALHVVLDRHLVTGQNAGSTVPAVQNLLFLCGSR